MRMPPLLADFIYNRVCKLKCEKFLTRPKYTEKRRENKHASHNFTGNPHDPVAAAWNAYEQRLTCVPISMRKEGDPQ